MDNQGIWIFNGSQGRFPSAVFSKLNIAEKWIADNMLSGILTLYPLNEGVYHWAIKNGFFTPSKVEELSSSFIQSFTSGSQMHFHNENGKRE